VARPSLTAKQMCSLFIDKHHIFPPTNHQNYSAIFCGAIRSNKASVVRVWLSHGFVPDVEDFHAHFVGAFFEAAHNGGAKILQVLIDYNMAPLPNHGRMKRAFCRATSCGHTDVLRVLLDHVVRPDHDAELEKCVCRAVHRKHWDVLSFTVEHGLVPDTPETRRVIAAMYEEELSNLRSQITSRCMLPYSSFQLCLGHSRLPYFFDLVWTDFISIIFFVVL